MLKKFRVTLGFLLFSQYWLLIPVGMELNNSILRWIFIGTACFVPGIALPIIVSISYKLTKNIIKYVLISELIYCLAIWVFSSNRGSGLAYVAAFMGAFLFILLTNNIAFNKKAVFDKKNLKHALIGGTLAMSGFVTIIFIDTVAFSKFMFSLFFIVWTFFVGLIIDINSGSVINVNENELKEL